MNLPEKDAFVSTGSDRGVCQHPETDLHPNGPGGGDALERDRRISGLATFIMKAARQGRLCRILSP